MGLATGFTSSASGGSSGGTITSNITAHPGGGQTNATVLTTNKNEVTVAASSGDSVKAITATVGAWQEIYNDSANDINAYPVTGQNFIGLAANAPLNVPVGGKLIITCFNAGVWSY